MIRHPLPQRMTMDGRQLAVQAPELIRNLLDVFSRAEILAMLQNIVSSIETLRGTVNGLPRFSDIPAPEVPEIISPVSFFYVLHLKNTTTGRYVPLTVVSPGGISQLDFGTEVSAPPSFLDFLYLRNATTGGYVPLTVVSPDGVPQLDFGTEIVAPTTLLDVLFLRNATTGEYVPLTVVSPDGVPQLDFGHSCPSVLYLKNTTTGGCVPITVISPDNVPQFDFGAETS